MLRFIYKVGVKVGYGDSLPPLSQIHPHDSAVVRYDFRPPASAAVRHAF
jgi:hypothetical protein